MAPLAESESGPGSASGPGSGSAASGAPSFHLATNVVLRDTIERLYPHVLRRRAVDDIQVWKEEEEHE